jgi:hypothetical protein
MSKQKTIWQIYGERGGRPRKYATEKAFQNAVNDYFDFLLEYDQKPTITGLTLYLGFCDRKSFYEYEKSVGFTHTVKRARTMVEHHYEQLIQGHNNAGAIFALKNMGWVDKTEVEQTITEQKQVFKIGDQIISFD